MAFTIDPVNITLYIDGAPVDTNTLAANKTFPWSAWTLLIWARAGILAMRLDW